MKWTIRTVLLVSLLGLSACGGNAPPAPAASAANTGEATETAGDVTIRASALQTSTLDETVAKRYGIARDDKSVLLLVAVRKSDGADETSLPAKVTASAGGLSGGKQAIAMRELRTGDLLDYIGTVETSLPETLRFEVTVVREGGATSNLKFNREFYPR
ncbi:DUF4426 domain-containing protein [Luteimonas sp. SX5]|uniref:DUF4426 domain-containing protein n=1 Tax=Luteimonas galliterrae TaxID=2940486 RepID=A0ABT0MM19_9GAMM|nr:DUF4426 domain-containing protein [Luteimonas galliterrae]MCL1635275.1 DUF4426 domain-containing protein [Luteimonas galliterrae]